MDSKTFDSCRISLFSTFDNNSEIDEKFVIPIWQFSKRPQLNLIFVQLIILRRPSYSIMKVKSPAAFSILLVTNEVNLP